MGVLLTTGAFAANTIKTQISGVKVVSAVTPTESAVLKHSYTFEGDTTVVDKVGTVNGVITGAATVSGGALNLDGGAVSFDGAALNLNAYTAVTMEFLYNAKVGANSGHWNWISYFGGANGANSFMAGVNTWGQYRLYKNNTTPKIEVASADDGKLHHVIAIMTATKIKMYADGVKIGEQAVGALAIGPEFAYLGRAYWSDPNWQGKVLEFNIYEGEMDSTTVSAKSDAKLNASNSYLKSIAASVGSISPTFEPARLDYALTVPAGTTTVNVAVAPRVAEALVTMVSGDKGFAEVSGTETNNLDVTLVDGKATVRVQVISTDKTNVSEYVIYVGEAGNCYTPLMETGNIIVDPQMTDLANFAGWGSKGLVVNPAEVYCGPTTAFIGSGTGTGSGSLDYKLVGKIQDNSTYRIRANVKTIGGTFQMGIWGWSGTAADINNVVDTKGAWKQLDFTITTGTLKANDHGMFINNWACTGTKAYADNWEMYKVDVANSLTVKFVDRFGVDVKTPVTAPSYKNLGEVLKASSSDKANFTLNDIAFTYDSTSVDSVVLASGANVITLKFKSILDDRAFLRHSYTFEGDTAVVDKVGNVNGVLKGTATVANGSLILDANGDYVTFDGAALALNSYSAITMEYSYTGSAAANTGWNWTGYFGNDGGSNAFYTTLGHWNNEIRSTYNGQEILLRGLDVNNGKLHHLVAVLTTSANKLYKDGVLIASVANNKGIAIGTTNALLGKGPWNDPTWQGTIAEFNIYEGELTAQQVADKADVVLTPTSSLLKNIQLSTGTLAPAFASGTLNYGAKVPAGTTTVNVAVAPKNPEALVACVSGLVDFVQATAVSSTNVDIAMVDGRGIATIQVIAADLKSTSLYHVYIVEDKNCFTPLMETGNIVPDPEVTDITKFAGWGTKSITYDAANVYCGASSASIGNGTGTCSGSIDVGLVGKIEAATTYRVRTMAKTTDGAFQIGLWGFSSGQPDLNNVFDTKGEWKQLDFTFTSGATLKTNDHGMFINNCGASTGKRAYADNWEMYKVDEANTVTIKYTLEGASLKDSVKTATTALLGTVIKAATADKADIMIGDIKYRYDSTSVDSVVLASGKNVINLKFKSTVGFVNAVQLSNKVYVVDQTLHVDVAMTSTANVSVNVVDMQGKSVSSQSVKMNAGLNSLTFDLPSKGVYFVRINSGDQTSVQKVVR